MKNGNVSITAFIHLAYSLQIQQSGEVSMTPMIKPVIVPNLGDISMRKHKERTIERSTMVQENINTKSR